MLQQYLPTHLAVLTHHHCAVQGLFNVVLDGKRVKTPTMRRLAVPSRMLALAIAAEFQYQSGDLVRCLFCSPQASASWSHTCCPTPLTECTAALLQCKAVCKYAGCEKFLRCARPCLQWKPKVAMCGGGTSKQNQMPCSRPGQYRHVRWGNSQHCQVFGESVEE